MAKINKTNVYPIKLNPTMSDYFIGTDNSTFNQKTVNFNFASVSEFIFSYIAEQLGIVGYPSGNAQQPDGLISGGIVSWSGTGYIYDVSGAIFRISGNLYYSESGQIILENGDPNFSRVDSVFASIDGFGVITGEPAESPIIPQIDYSNQVLLTNIIVGEGTTQPLDVENENIYLENQEWAGNSDGIGTTIFESTTSPFQGNFAIENTNVANNHRVIMDNQDFINISNYDLITLKIKLKEPLNINQSIWIGCLNSDGDYIYAFKKLILNPNSKGYQTVSIQISEIVNSFSINSSLETTSICLIFKDTQPAQKFYKGYFIDNWLLQKNNLEQENSTLKHNQIPGLQGGSPELDEFYHISKNKFEDINSQYLPDGLISGGIVSWSGTGYQYHISPAIIRLGGLIYKLPYQLITLLDSNVIDRFDSFYASPDGFGVITGEPAESPVIPQIEDFSKQILLTSVLVEGGSAEPSYTTNENIYLENQEWAGSSDGVGNIDFDNQDNPRTGVKSIKASNIGTGTIIFMDKGVDFQTQDYETISLWIWLGSGINIDSDRFYIGITNSLNNKIIRSIQLPLLANYREWQLVSISLSEYKNITGRKIYLTTTISPTHKSVVKKEFYIDDWTLQLGVEQTVPTSYHNSLSGLQGGTETERYHLTEEERDKVNTAIQPYDLISQTLLNQHTQSSTTGDTGTNLLQPDSGASVFTVDDMQAGSSYTGEIYLEIDNNSTATAKVIELFWIEIYQATSAIPEIKGRLTFDIDFYNQAGNIITYRVSYGFVSPGLQFYGSEESTINNTVSADIELTVNGDASDNIYVNKAKIKRENLKGIL